MHNVGLGGGYQSHSRTGKNARAADKYTCSIKLDQPASWGEQIFYSFSKNHRLKAWLGMEGCLKLILFLEQAATRPGLHITLGLGGHQSLVSVQVLLHRCIPNISSPRGEGTTPAPTPDAIPGRGKAASAASRRIPSAAAGRAPCPLGDFLCPRVPSGVFCVPKVTSTLHSFFPPARAAGARRDPPPTTESGRGGAGARRAGRCVCRARRRRSRAGGGR